MQKIITFIVTIFIVIIILVGLGKQIAAAIQSSKRLDTEADQVNQLQIQNRQLKEKLSTVQKYDFIEQIARDELNMSQNGDTVVVVPDETIGKILDENKPVPQIVIPNWQGWLKLFLH